MSQLLESLLDTRRRREAREGDATLHRARNGRRRSFLSASDASAYDRGWEEHCDGSPLTAPINTPHATGWADAESAILDGLAA